MALHGALAPAQDASVDQQVSTLGMFDATAAQALFGSPAAPCSGNLHPVDASSNSSCGSAAGFAANTPNPSAKRRGRPLAFSRLPAHALFNHTLSNAGHAPSAIPSEAIPAHFGSFASAADVENSPVTLASLLAGVPEAVAPAAKRERAAPRRAQAPLKRKAAPRRHRRPPAGPAFRAFSTNSNPEPPSASPWAPGAILASNATAPGSFPSLDAAASLLVDDCFSESGTAATAPIFAGLLTGASVPRPEAFMARVYSSSPLQPRCGADTSVSEDDPMHRASAVFGATPQPSRTATACDSAASSSFAPTGSCFSSSTSPGATTRRGSLSECDGASLLTPAARRQPVAYPSSSPVFPDAVQAAADFYGSVSHWK